MDAYKQVLDSGVDVDPTIRPDFVRCISPPWKPANTSSGETHGHRCTRIAVGDEERRAGQEKGLAVVAGSAGATTMRGEFFKRIADGAIGDVQTMYATYYTGL